MYYKYYKIILCIALMLSSNALRAENLMGALHKTYNYNPKILAERGEYKAQKSSAYSQAFGAILPNLRMDYNQTSTTDNKDNNIRLSADQVLFRGGEFIYQYNAAKEAVDAKKYQVHLKEQEMLFGAISVYLEVIKNREIQELSKRNVAILEQYQERAKAQYDLGDATKTTLAFAKSRLSFAISEQLKAQAVVMTSEANYQHIIGEEPSELERPHNIPTLPPTLEDVMSIASKNNHMLSIAHSKQKSACYNAKTVKAKLMPTITASISSIFDDKASQNTQIVGINIIIPMLNRGGVNIWKVKEATYNVQNAKYEYLDTVRTIKKNISATWKNIEAAKYTVYSSEDVVNSAQIALSAAQQEYELRMKTMLEILDAERDLFAAHIELIKAKHEYIISTYRLIMFMGKLKLNNIGL